MEEFWETVSVSTTWLGFLRWVNHSAVMVTFFIKAKPNKLLLCNWHRYLYNCSFCENKVEWRNWELAGCVKIIFPAVIQLIAKLCQVCSKHHSSFVIFPVPLLGPCRVKCLTMMLCDLNRRDRMKIGLSNWTLIFSVSTFIKNAFIKRLHCRIKINK